MGRACNLSRFPARNTPSPDPSLKGGEIASTHQLRRDILGGIDADRGRLRRERAHVIPDLIRDRRRRRRTRGPHSRIGVRDDAGAHRVDALALLDGHQPVGVLDIDMAIMRQTPRLAPRPRAVTPDLIRGRRRAQSCARDARE